MQATNFSLRHYFERIGFKGEPKADIATVTELMRCQLFTVPFENLDVQAGKIVSMVPEEIVDKIVARSRGGYCYEVAGVFAMALQAIGVPFQLVAGRPMTYPTRRPRTHMALVVTLDGTRWLCDLGFGGYGIRAPLNLDVLDIEVRQGYETYKLTRDADDVYVVSALVEGQWANQYGFDLSRQEWVDFVPANHLNSTHPESIFVQRLIAVLQTEAGRKILVDDTLKIFEHGHKQQRTITPDERVALLASEFGLTLPEQ